MKSKHTSAQGFGRTDPASVNISRPEYDSLLRTAREYELLKTALFQGGLTQETLDLLIAGAGDPARGQDPIESWADDIEHHRPSYDPLNGGHGQGEMHWRSGAASAHANSYVNGNGTFRAAQKYPDQGLVGSNRKTSYGMFPLSNPEEAFDSADSYEDGEPAEAAAQDGSGTMRTLYFCGFPPKTTYRDLVSAIKGGKLLSINLRSEKSATVTFQDGAADFLAWAKRNDVYIQHKRVDVRWAERQFQLNSHVAHKVSTGATRNILVRGALGRGLTEAQIRDDMEHIHGLVIIDINFRNGNAHISTNSVHNALFARTCMLSRSTYKGCKIEFYPDECDAPLPSRLHAARALPKGSAKANNVSLANRFNMLNMDEEDADSGAENRDPLQDQDGDSDDDGSFDMKARHGVRLDFLDSETAA